MTPSFGDKQPQGAARDVGDEARQQLVLDPGLLLALVIEVVAEQALVLRVSPMTSSISVIMSITAP